MYEKEKDRGRIIGIAQVADVLGGVIASVAVEPVFTKYGWSAMATIFGCIGAIVMLLTVFGIRENPKHAAQPSLPLLQSIRQTFRSRSFLICVCCVFFVETARLLLMAAVPYYAKYIFPDVDMADLVMTSVVFVSALLFTPLVIFVSNRIGTKKTYILSLLLFALVACGFFFSSSFILSVVLSVLLGLGVTGGLLMPKLLYTEIIDEDQSVTGLRREGAFYGIQAFIIRFASGLQAVILSLIMGIFGYVEGAQTQVASAATGFKVAMSFLPAGLVLIGCLIITRYPLYGERLAQVKQKIAAGESAEQ